MKRLPDFLIYFGPPRELGFKPIAFWVFPVLTPITLHSLINTFLSDPWVRA